MTNRVCPECGGSGLVPLEQLQPAPLNPSTVTSAVERGELDRDLDRLMIAAAQRREVLSVAAQRREPVPAPTVVEPGRIEGLRSCGGRCDICGRKAVQRDAFDGERCALHPFAPGEAAT